MRTCLVKVTPLVCRNDRVRGFGCGGGSEPLDACEHGESAAGNTSCSAAGATPAAATAAAAAASPNSCACYAYAHATASHSQLGDGGGGGGGGTAVEDEGLQAASAYLAQHAAQARFAACEASEVSKEWSRREPASSLLHPELPTRAREAQVRGGGLDLQGVDHERVLDEDNVEGRRPDDSVQLLPDGPVQATGCRFGCTTNPGQGEDCVGCGDARNPTHHGGACGDTPRMEDGGEHVLGGAPQLEEVHATDQRQLPVHDGSDAALLEDGDEGAEADVQAQLSAESCLQAAVGPGVSGERGRGVAKRRLTDGEWEQRRRARILETNVSLRWDGCVYQAGLRAKLREALALGGELKSELDSVAMAEEAQAIRGRCPHLCCRRRYEELQPLRPQPRAASRSGRSGTDAGLQAEVQQHLETIAELRRDAADAKRRRAFDRKQAETAASAASTASASLEEATQQLVKSEASLAKVAKQRADIEARAAHQKERFRQLLQRSKEVEREFNSATAALQQSKASSAVIDENVAKLETKISQLEERSEELRRLKISTSRSGNLLGAREPKPLTESSSWAGASTEQLLEAMPKDLTPESKKFRGKLVHNIARREQYESEQLADAIGEQRNPQALVTAMIATDTLLSVWDTEEVYALRVKDAQALIVKINQDWDGRLAARMKFDYLLSNRDLDAMRCDSAVTGRLTSYAVTRCRGFFSRIPIVYGISRSVFFSRSLLQCVLVAGSPSWTRKLSSSVSPSTRRTQTCLSAASTNACSTS